MDRVYGNKIIASLIPKTEGKCKIMKQSGGFCWSSWDMVLERSIFSFLQLIKSSSKKAASLLYGQFIKVSGIYKDAHSYDYKYKLQTCLFQKQKLHWDLFAFSLSSSSPLFFFSPQLVQHQYYI